MEQQRLGSTRFMTPVEPGVIALKYRNTWSAFDRGRSPQEIQDFDISRCACAVRSFEIAHSYGLETHFVRQHDDTTIHVLECEVPGQKPLSGKTHARVLDAEFIWRTHAKGSLIERINAGTLDVTTLGFARGTLVTDGMKLPRMIKECTTKFESVDRHLTDEDTRERVGLSEEEWDAAWALVERSVHFTAEVYGKAGYDTPDGKMELAITPDGQLMIVDVFGTQDENRIINKKTGEAHSKDILRDHLKTTPWYATLREAKALYPKDKSKWPPYPTLSDEVVEVASTRYMEVARNYGILRAH